MPASSPQSKAAQSAIVLGCSGLELTTDEAAFFNDFNPVGFILFARNCESPAQVKALTASLRGCVGRDAPILIDQEGGRVARLKPPYWPTFPSMRTFGVLAETSKSDAVEACRLNAELIGYELAILGIDVDCAPVLDLAFAGAHQIIGDRAFGSDPILIAELGRAVCEGLQNAGVTPIIKHIPGHGRALVDSHLSLPKVDASLHELVVTDFAPFKALADQPWAMVAHVLYSAIDKNEPASTSPDLIETILRREIGFDGILIADDVGMEALKGSLSDRAQATLAAGNDLTLHCSGKLDEMIALAPGVTPLTSAAQRRLDRGKIKRPELIDLDATKARLKVLLSETVSA